MLNLYPKQALQQRNRLMVFCLLLLIITPCWYAATYRYIIHQEITLKALNNHSDQLKQQISNLKPIKAPALQTMKRNQIKLIKLFNFVSYWQQVNARYLAVKTLSVENNKWVIQLIINPAELKPALTLMEKSPIPLSMTQIHRQSNEWMLKATGRSTF